MLKVVSGIFIGAVAAALLIYNLAAGMMFREVPSPFGMEETVARIQQNVLHAGNGWSLSGLRNAAKPIDSARSELTSSVLFLISDIASPTTSSIKSSAFTTVPAREDILPLGKRTMPYDRW